MKNKKIFNIKIIENLLTIILVILFLINLPFLLKIISYAQSLSYTLFKTNNKVFTLRYYSTQFGNYNLELSKDSSYIPTIYFYSTNTNNNSNKYLFSIKPFYSRSLLYSVNTITKDHIVIDLKPPIFGVNRGSSYFYKYTPAPGGGYYTNYAKIYGDIRDLIAVYDCEDRAWDNAGGTCLGADGNPNYCFGQLDFGKVIFNGLLMGDRINTESGLTICVRTKK